MLANIVQITTSGFTSLEAVGDIERFFSDKSTKGFDQGLAQSIDGVKAKAAWLDRDKEDVTEWLKSNGYLRSSNL